MIGAAAAMFPLVLLAVFAVVGAINDNTLPSGLFYPFGPDQGDSTVPPDDDGGAGPVQLSIGFPFGNVTYDTLNVSKSRPTIFCCLFQIPNRTMNS